MPLPIVTAIALDAGVNAGPLVWLAHALHHLDGDLLAARSIVDDLFDSDNVPVSPADLGGSRFPI